MEGLSRRSSLHLTSLGTIYACQENAWMDEGVMLLWVEKVLKSQHLKVFPLLLLDSYRCHVMASVVNEIQDSRSGS